MHISIIWESVFQQGSILLVQLSAKFHYKNTWIICNINLRFETRAVQELGQHLHFFSGGGGGGKQEDGGDGRSSVDGFFSLHLQDFGTGLAWNAKY